MRKINISLRIETEEAYQDFKKELVSVLTGMRRKAVIDKYTAVVVTELEDNLIEG
jgi:hypothetical protein